MTKKQDFIRSEQSRDKHPDRMMKGSAADLQSRAPAKEHHDPDGRQPGGGKVDNERNKAGHTTPTAKHESQRTPASRHEREARVGGHNQVQASTGGKGTGRTPRGGGGMGSGGG